MTLKDTLQLADRLCKEALPKFNWGASALDANAIDLLNRAPSAIAKALIQAPDLERDHKLMLSVLKELIRTELFLADHPQRIAAYVAARVAVVQATRSAA